MTLDNIKSIEESQTDELRRRLKGQMNQNLYEDDNMFVRFLRARNHNIDAAETMLKNHLNFRKQHKLDTILTEYKPHEFMKSEYITLNRLGTDLDNAPLSYLHFGHLDTRGILKSVSKHDIMMYIVQYLESDMLEMKKQNEKTGQFLDKCVYILNFENFSLGTATHKPTLETLGALIRMYEGNFPERLKTAYIINVSYYFTLFWAVLKQFLSAATVNKIKIYGKTGWQEEIRQHISPETLPAFLGGNRTDPDGDPRCKTLIRYGGPVPEQFFFCSAPSPSSLLGARRLHVARMSKAEVTLHVLRPGSLVEWEFVMKNRDISFSLLHKDQNSDQCRVVVPQQRVEAGGPLSESGMYQCVETGTYVLQFDNSYSWMHSKEIYYTATVVNPPQNSRNNSTSDAA